MYNTHLKNKMVWLSLGLWANRKGWLLVQNLKLPSQTSQNKTDEKNEKIKNT